MFLPKITKNETVSLSAEKTNILHFALMFLVVPK